MKGPRGKPLEPPPEIARRFFEDLRAYHREKNPLKADEIAARQVHALRQYQRPREKKPEIQSRPARKPDARAMAELACMAQALGRFRYQCHASDGRSRPFYD
jgi:hypothetical protein